MPGLFSTIQMAGNALGAYSSAMSTLQQNLVNLSTPGYARQKPILLELTFQPANGLTGGVAFGGTQDTRDPALEEAVRLQTSQSQHWQAQSSALQQIASNLDPGSSAGLSSMLRTLFKDFQGWASSPDDTDQKSVVLNQARLAASTLSDTAQNITQLRDTNRNQISQAVANINELAVQIADTASSDPLARASLFNSLEQLSELADISVTYSQDGSVNVLLGGQVPLVVGNHARSLAVAPLDNTGQVKILDENGNDVTNALSDGKLAGYLELANKTFPSLLGGGDEPGSLNLLAKTLADKVNEALGGTGLFSYDTSNVKNAASTLQVPVSVTEDTLNASAATIQNLASLGNGASTAGELGGRDYAGFYEQVVSQQSLAASSAQTMADRHATLLDQAQTLRTQASGVSLETEAVELLQLQQNFQAATKVMSTVNGLIDTLLAMIK
jgi:flagellar hook-associated protein 1 FlgK